MQLCSDGHVEICYDERDCPLCAAYEEIEDLQQKVNVLQDDIEELKISEES